MRDMKKLAYDGLEDGAWSARVSFRCSECNKTISATTEQFVKNSKLPRYARKQQSQLKQHNFAYDAVLRCPNGHTHIARIRFEETQPARYQVELLDHKRVIKTGFRKLMEGVLVVVLLSIIPVTIAYVNISYFLSAHRANYLAQNGIKTAAVVIDRYGDSGGVKRAAVYELTYTYSVDGRMYTDEKKVDVNTYTFAEIDDDINITYDPENPEITDVEGNDELFLNGFVVILLDVVVVLAAIWIVYSARREARQRSTTSKS